MSVKYLVSEYGNHLSSNSSLLRLYVHVHASMGEGNSRLSGDSVDSLFWGAFAGSWSRDHDDVIEEGIGQTLYVIYNLGRIFEPICSVVALSIAREFAHAEI